ncbi:MAG TPA: 3-methyl-2-oxobutanoate hydroxymethyltransferase [Tepidisphaeraceae bacterium]|nr:3-methyl-2-oxobutanoate hydroxymethyltransferase [Tepidisphaeraceae bacterium]
MDTGGNKFTMKDLRLARQSGTKVAMLTCYDFTMARLMSEAGVRAMLVGDSAANVILGHATTLPISAEFLIELTAAVRRGAPQALVVADMPFGSYQRSAAQGVKNVCRMVQHSGCDCVKLELTARQSELVRRLADSGVAVMGHLGLRPQTVGLMGGYRAQARTPREIEFLVKEAAALEKAGAAAILLEAVPAAAARAVIEAVGLPVMGCGAGPDCHGHVVVAHDALGLTENPPRFVPVLGDMASALKDCFADYVRRIADGKYPEAQHEYEMSVKPSAAGAAEQVK